MSIPAFETEEFFGKYEFTKPFLVSASDCENVEISELLRLGGGSLDQLAKIKLGYTEMPGSEILRREIAKLYSSVSENSILVLGTPIEGIFITMSTLLEKGDHVVVLSPAYDALFNVAQHVSGNASRWHLKNNGVEWSLDFQELEKLLTQRTRLLVINFPHNPTGFQPKEAELRKILELANRNGVRVLSDEMYRGLEYSKSSQLPSVSDLSEKAVVLSGASKSLGLPGLRFGWLVCKDPSLYLELLNFKTYTSMCGTQAGEYLGLMALRAFTFLAEKNLRIVKENLLLTEAFVNKWEKQIQWLRPMAGTVSVIKLSEPSAEAFCHKLAEKFGVVLLPTRFMGLGDQYARIGLGRTNFGASLKVFDSALKSIYG